MSMTGHEAADGLAVLIEAVRAAEAMKDVAPESVEDEVEAGASQRELATVMYPFARLSRTTLHHLGDVLEYYAQREEGVRLRGAFEPGLRLVDQEAG